MYKTLIPALLFCSALHGETSNESDWNGWYGGCHFGQGFGYSQNTFFDPDPNSSHHSFGSLYGGLQLGYNYLLPNGLLAGLEGNFTFPNFLEDGIVHSWHISNEELKEELDFVSRLRGRFGYTCDKSLVYFTGGLAWSETRFLKDKNSSKHEHKRVHLRTGWTVGAGAEYIFSPYWTARLEYLYDHLGATQAFFSSGLGCKSSKKNLQSILFGLSRKLEWPDKDETSDKDNTQDIEKENWLIDPENWNVHGQFTFIEQGYYKFHSPYQGTNSLTPNNQAKNTTTATLFLGLRLWEGAELYANPELDQGFGLSDTLGLAAFPNGEAQKSDFPIPRFNFAQAFLRQTIGLGGEQEVLEDGPNQLEGKVDISRITVTVGKVAISDFFDQNTYANDPRSQFMNWNIYGGGSYDWPTDQLGFSWGLIFELNQKSWAFRTGYFLVPTVSNVNTFDMKIPTHGGYTAELEFRYSPFSKEGKLRLLGWLNRAKMGSYKAALDMPKVDRNYPDIKETRKIRTNYGFIVNIEQAITEDLGVFSRASWSPGLDEIIGWTDCSRSVSLGAVLKGTSWCRPDDVIGLAGVIEGLSKEAREYFAAGGLGIMIGDGRLNYHTERALELYYDFSLNKGLTLTFDYQFIENPAYNADRGPVSFFTGRIHAEF